MNQVVSKAQFKPHVLEYLRNIESSKKPLIITHKGKPVIQIIPYFKKSKTSLKSLKGTVISYKDPTEPVGEESWQALK